MVCICSIFYGIMVCLYCENLYSMAWCENDFCTLYRYIYVCDPCQVGLVLLTFWDNAAEIHLARIWCEWHYSILYMAGILLIISFNILVNVVFCLLLSTYCMLFIAVHLYAVNYHTCSLHLYAALPHIFIILTCSFSLIIYFLLLLLLLFQYFLVKYQHIYLIYNNI